ncbi:MAG: NADP-dependent malic enzyme [Candidatus Thermoplasmatota archaeon]|jgi:malate dehydrogenase (oxaloacetate-decarboxylating)|nr:NADP-dependent malic enzyme [Candidatus Thermoplasmatota archaeon]
MNDEERTANFNRLAIKYSQKYRGKINTMPKVPINKLGDFSIWYTPGVAAVSEKIKEDHDLSFELTGRWNSVAIVTDGTRVLGLGNIGPEAAMPVMEGKALIFNYLGGINAIPLPVKTDSREYFNSVVRSLEPSFGAINLEDIESPKCFFILDELQKSMNIPVWHDDQLGTASITLAGLINALRIVGKKKEDVRIALIGSGAANLATAYLLKAAGFNTGNLIIADHLGVLEPEREDMDKLMINNPWKYKFAMESNRDRIKGGIENSIKGADVIISAAKSQPGFIRKEWIKTMNSDPIVFALANPSPEIWPGDAKAAGARIVATGRSDFPNQINNSLVFPSLFRGVLDARAKGVNFDVMVTASEEIANFVENPVEEMIIPRMDQYDLYPRVAAAVAYKTSQLGLARRNNSKEWFYNNAKEIIDFNRKIYGEILGNGLIERMDE